MGSCRALDSGQPEFNFCPLQRRAALLFEDPVSSNRAPESTGSGVRLDRFPILRRNRTYPATAVYLSIFDQIRQGFAEAPPPPRPAAARSLAYSAALLGFLGPCAAATSASSDCASRNAAQRARCG